MIIKLNRLLTGPWVSGVNLLFMVISFSLIAYSAARLLWIPFQLQKMLRVSSPVFSSQFDAWQLRPLDTYLQSFRTHSLFYIPKVQTAAQSQGISEITNQYELTGIIQGAESEALIQNRSTKQTHFVQVGDSFDQLTLKAIHEHSVVVEYQGEQTELYIQEGL